MPRLAPRHPAYRAVPLLFLAASACAVGALNTGGEGGVAYGDTIDGEAPIASDAGVAPGVDGSTGGGIFIASAASSSGVATAATAATGVTSVTSATSATSDTSATSVATSSPETSTQGESSFTEPSSTHGHHSETSSYSSESYGSSSDDYSCSHSPCTAGAKLEDDCDENEDDLVWFICDKYKEDMPDCCHDSWSQQCADTAKELCGEHGVHCTDPGCSS